MKTESTAMYMIRLTVTLLLIAGIVAAALAAVNMYTKPIIDQLNAEKTQKAINAVLEGGGEEIEFTDDTGLVTKVYKGANGYAVQVAPSGFDGEIDMMVGIDLNGNVTAISVINQTETAGLGAVCAANTSAGEAFRASFAGLSGEVLTAKDGGQADTITGATITSRAVASGVSAALACVANMG